MSIALADDHVAAVTVAALEIASCGGIFLHWRNHFDEVAAHRHQRVLEAEDRDVWVLEADFEAQHRLEVGNRGRELFGYQANLAKANRHWLLHGARTVSRGRSMMALAAP